MYNNICFFRFNRIYSGIQKKDPICEKGKDLLLLTLLLCLGLNKYLLNEWINLIANIKERVSLGDGCAQLEVGWAGPGKGFS